MTRVERPRTARPAGPVSRAGGPLPIVSVVIPCRGHARELAGCLRAVTAQSLGEAYEVIVVDSAHDPTVAAAAARFLGVRLVRDRAPLNAGEARNLGAAEARAPYLAFTDADCLPHPGWLAAALSALRAGAPVVGGPVLDARALHPIAAADHLLQFAEFGPRRPDGPASHFPGCNIATGREAFRRLGGFPPVPVGEDTLFSGAASGTWPGCVRFVPSMRVSHTGRAGWRAFCRHQAVFGFARGRLGLRVRPSQQRAGRHAVLALPIVAKRWIYVLVRTARWHPAALWRAVLLTPVLLVGLGAWTAGFRSGCRAWEGEVG